MNPEPKPNEPAASGAAGSVLADLADSAQAQAQAGPIHAHGLATDEAQSPIPSPQPSQDAACSDNEAKPALNWSPSSQVEAQARLGVALYHLQQWLLELQRHRYVQEDEEDEGLLRLTEEVSSRFALGLLPQSAFIVMPQLESQWACLVPWSHAAMHEGDPTLHLVISKVHIDEMEGADFGISFVIPDFAKASMLCIRRSLELRRYIQTEIGWRVEGSAMATMPMELLEAGRSVFDKKKRKLKFKGRGKS